MFELKVKKNIAILGQKIVKVRGTSFQRRRLKILTYCHYILD